MLPADMIYPLLINTVVSLCALAVCGGGRADHITGGSVSVLPKEGLPQRGLHRYYLLHQLRAWTHHGYQGNDTMKNEHQKKKRHQSRPEHFEDARDQDNH